MPKRGNNEGSIRQRTDGRWEARITVGRKADGKPEVQSVYGHTRKAVQEKLRALQSDMANGLDVTAKYTFEDWADLWFARHRETISPTTQQSYGYTLTKLKGYFGSKLLKDIKPYDIEEFLRHLQNEGCSSSYLAKCRAMLYQIFHKAEANDIVRKNPVRFAEKTKSREKSPEKEAFTAEEVQLLMDNLPEDRIGLTIRLMLGTGMRGQEVLALEPYLIAEDGSGIRIRQAVQLVKGTVVVGPPKSADSYRDIPVPPNLWDCAVKLRSINGTCKHIWETGKKDTPCDPKYFRKQFKEAVSNVEGVRVLTPHSCRHTYVSQLQALGVDISTIKSIVGHADVDMTEHYLHVQEPVRKDAVERFAEAFRFSKKTGDNRETGSTY